MGVVTTMATASATVTRTVIEKVLQAGEDGVEQLVEVSTEVNELVIGEVHGFGHRELSVDHFEHHFPIHDDHGRSVQNLGFHGFLFGIRLT